MSQTLFWAKAGYGWNSQVKKHGRDLEKHSLMGYGIISSVEQNL